MNPFQHWSKEDVAKYNAKRNAKVAGSAPSPTPSPEPQRAIRDDTVAAGQGAKGNPPRRRVSIISYRRRLIDPDNLCPKYFIDAIKAPHPR